MSRRRVLLPDLDEELTAALGRAEELLRTVHVWVDDPDAPSLDLPEVLSGRQAVDAVDCLAVAVRPSQRTRTRLLAPDGRYEHTPLTLVELDQRDLDVLGETASSFRAVLDPKLRPTAIQAEVMEILEDSLPETQHPDARAAVDELTRLHRLLTVPWSANHDRIAEALTSTPAGQPVRLDHVGETAYQALARQFNGIWTGGNALAAYLY